MGVTLSTGQFTIGEHSVGGGTRAYVIGEVAQAHDGSLGMAHAFIDAIAAAGADAVKFQTHMAEAESSPDEPWRVRFSPQDPSRFEYWRRMEFRDDQWRGLKDHAEQKGLVFLSSPFSVQAVELLDGLGMPAWKIASGEVNNPILLERIAQTGKPILLSTGMSPLSEIDRVVHWIKSRACPLAVLQCSSTYPTPPEKLGLNVLSEYRQRYACPVGLSDHSGTIFAGLAAAALGADLLEVHVTLSREMFGPDVIASVTTSELAQLVEGVRFIERARACPIDKDAVAPEFEGVRQIFTKSLFAAVDLPAGTRLLREHLIARKPGTGIPADQVDAIVGLRLVTDVKRWRMLKRDDVGPG
jgi:N,N'-diacetyllegionaminate synthase